jgi:biopolymer transport protein ExbB/TolQ
VKRSSSWIAVLPSLVIPVCFGMILYLGLSYLIQEGQIANETVLRYLTGHPVSKVTVGMFFIGMASLVLISKNVFEQFGNERKITFKTMLAPGLADEIDAASGVPTPSSPQASTSEAASLLSDVVASDSDSAQSLGEDSERTIELGKHLLEMPAWMQEHYLWQRMVDALHSIYRTNSTASVEDELKFLAEMDLDRQEQRYSLVRILIWATPMLGFLGTVLGISQALGGINVGPDNDFQQMMDGLRGSLYVAFDTTALALTLSMVMMFCQFLVERFETQLLMLVDQRAKQEINSEFDMTVTTLEAGYENATQKLLDASRESFEQQTQNWRESMLAAEGTWVSSLGQANARAQSELCKAVDESVSNLASSLGQAIDKADNSMSHRWSQWQVTLSDNARLMAGYQERLGAQTVAIQEVLQRDQVEESLAPVLEQNQEAVAATSRLQESIDELVARVAELQQRPVSGESSAQCSIEAGKSNDSIESDVTFPDFRSRSEVRLGSVHPSKLADVEVILPLPKSNRFSSYNSQRNSKRAA